MLHTVNKWTLGHRAKIVLAVSALMLGAVAAAAQASSADVALVTKITGAVSYGSDGGPQRGAQAFMKIRQGDQFQVPQGGVLQVVFFANGRQETWSGPAHLKIGEASGQAVGGRKTSPPPEVTVLPVKATRRLADAVPLSSSSLRHSGAIQTMAPRAVSPGEAPPGKPGKPAKPLTAAARQDLQEVERIYQQMVKGAPADDVTPELYYLGVLAEYGQSAKMAEVVAAMVAKRPGDPAVKKLQEWVRSQP